MKIVSDVRCNQPDFAGDGSDYAVTELSLESVTHMLNLMDEAYNLKQRIGSLHTIEIFEGRFDWFSYYEEMDEVLREAKRVSGTEGDMYGVYFVPDDFEYPEDNHERMECETVMVAPDEIWWEAYLKYSDITYRTIRLTRADLMEIKDELEKTEKETA